MPRQQIADLGAQVEGRRIRQVPRLDNDLALPDQLGVVAADLSAACLAAADPAADALTAAAELVRQTRLGL